MADMAGTLKMRKILRERREEEAIAKKPKLRVAAYCRVSTPSEEQATSVREQKIVYETEIRNNPEWEFAGVFADEGFSGTKVSNRRQFQDLLKACEEGKIDLVLAKSISRFSRNTMECIEYIRKLTEWGVRVRFDKEGIDTGEEYSEMLLTVLAAFAQEESRSLSENVKWGKRKRALQGNTLLLPVYGYCKTVEGDNYEIVPGEAEAVRRIFEWYEHGVSVPEITRRLTAAGYRKPSLKLSKKDAWDESRIHYMIRNEKYVGDLIVQKFVTEDHITHRIRLNEGAAPSKYIRDHHEPIVSRKQFERCNTIFKLKTRTAPEVGQYPFADYIRCPYCGHRLWRRRVGIQQANSHFCCEGEGACREFVIQAIPLEEAILSAYRDVDLETVKKVAGYKQRRRAAEAVKLLKIKEEYPVMEGIHYWWLDELVASITLGRHTYTATQLDGMPADLMDKADDRTVTIHWRCGLETTLPSGVIRDSHDPRHKAQLWDAFILRYPERTPALAEEVRKKRGIKD